MSFSFTPPTTSSSAVGGFSFGLQNTGALLGAAKPAPTLSFGNTGGGDAGLVKTPQTTSTGFLSSTPVTSVATATAPNATPTVSSFNFAAPTSTASSSSLALPKTTVSTLSLGAPTTTAAPGFANLSTATKTTDSSTVSIAAQMSYNQLEEHINKWTLELEEHEKVFADQATQINAWDKILISNNDKILELNDAVQKVKTDQQNLEQELEFIATQHKELEESILPLQKELTQLPQVDLERSQTYLLVENLDTQLKQMSEDLKEIIDNLNESNKGQENSDPIMQISKILNAHMSSLQWIESSSASITSKLEKITEMEENYKRDSERSFRSAYYT